MTARDLYEAIGLVDEKYLDIADAPAKESEPMKRKHITLKRATTYLLAAAIAVSLLMVTAAAAGWLPGIFNALKEKYPQDEALFSAAAQANSDAVPELRDIPQLDLSKFVLKERYFDGETILLGYDLDLILPEPVVGIQPEEALLKKIKKGTRISRIGWEKPQPWFGEPATENAIKHDLLEDAFTMDQMLKGTLSEKEYEKAWYLMEAQGSVCVAVRDVWLSDTVLINGRDIREDFNSETNAYSGRTDYTSQLGDCLRLDPLPESVKDQNCITVTLTVRSAVQYWYMDLKGNGRVYTDSDSVESEEMTFTLERSESDG